jgi:hypothetical protein
MCRSNRIVELAALGCLVGFAIPAFGQDISDSAAAQIADILNTKMQFTAVQQKIDSALVFAAMKARGELGAQPLTASLASADTDANGAVVVDITGAASEIETQVNAVGGQVIASSPEFGSVRASVPLLNLEELAASAAVTSISRQETARLNVGALTSQGYVSHRAKDVVTGLAVNGAGVKVGVLSDSASPARVAALMASGDLGPGTTVLAGQAGPTNGSDEGTAMMEIVQDLAPGAQLYFATAFTSSASFAANILALAAAGCGIIVDDVTYFAEGVFQDGPIARAVNTFVGAGGIYFSSAANSGNLTDGTSGTWEGDFLNGGPVTGPVGTAEGGLGFFHNFSLGGVAQNYDVLTAITDFISVKWSDPLGASSNDYDLFILNSTGTSVKGFSVRAQNGAQDPYEFVSQGINCGLPSASGYCPAVGDRIVVVQFRGATRALHLSTERGMLSIPTSGATYGHNAGQNTVGVAATYWNSAKTGTKPFVGATNPVEIFSSDGPRKIFYNPDGTAITPGNLLFGTNGGTTLQKPDITAADGTTAKTPGFNPFFGTSAAAPHAAGVAALVKSANPARTNAQIMACMTSTALDNMAPGTDRDGGVGIVMAMAAVQACQ